MPCQTAMNFMAVLATNAVRMLPTFLSATQHHSRREQVAEACVSTFGKRFIWQSFLGQLHRARSLLRNLQRIQLLPVLYFTEVSSPLAPPWQPVPISSSRSCTSGYLGTTAELPCWLCRASCDTLILQNLYGSRSAAHELRQQADGTVAGGWCWPVCQLLCSADSSCRLHR